MNEHQNVQISSILQEPAISTAINTSGGSVYSYIAVPHGLYIFLEVSVSRNIGDGTSGTRSGTLTK